MPAAQEIPARPFCLGLSPSVSAQLAKAGMPERETGWREPARLRARPPSLDMEFSASHAVEIRKRERIFIRHLLYLDTMLSV